MKSTLRENLKNSLTSISDSIIQDWWVDKHTACSCKWVEVYPNGTWAVTEEVSANTTHWLDYPNKQIESIYHICDSSSQYCDCWVCTLNRDYDNEEMTDEEFEQEYEFTRESIKDDSFKQLVADYYHNKDVYECQVRDELINAVDNIEYGYFDDEE